MIQEDYVQVLRRDDSMTKNITLIDRNNIHNNRLQVINQYVLGKEDGATYDNRYDVTILVNGLPLVHVELKRRGVPIREAFNQIERYQRDSFWAGSGLFEYVQIFIASADRGKVEEIKQKQRLSGFNSIFAVASVPMAKLYYDELRKIIKKNPTKDLKIAVIYSYAANEEEVDGILDEENPEDTSALDQNSRDFLESAIQDYNLMFHTNYDTSSDKFQNYYKDVSLRMKNKELDLLIVVNMFLTGFDATTLNTLWVDKNLKMHGLIQAFSRTNRILNSIKTFGIIIEEERLKPDETREFMDKSFQDGELKTIGTDIDRIMPPVSRFGGSGRAKKKEALIRRLMAYFEKFRGLV